MISFCFWECFFLLPARVGGQEEDAVAEGVVWVCAVPKYCIGSIYFFFFFAVKVIFKH